MLKLNSHFKDEDIVEISYGKFDTSLSLYNAINKKKVRCPLKLLTCKTTLLILSSPKTFCCYTKGCG